MCCGRNLLPESFTRSQPLPNKVVFGRTPARPASAPTATRAGMPAAKFAYVGSTGLTVVSPITGKRYRFDHSGAQLEVDPRDRSWMRFVPSLKAM